MTGMVQSCKSVSVLKTANLSSPFSCFSQQTTVEKKSLSSFYQAGLYRPNCHNAVHSFT